MGKFTDIPLHAQCKLVAIMKMFTMRLSCFGAIIKFWDKIYTPGTKLWNGSRKTNLTFLSFTLINVQLNLVQWTFSTFFLLRKKTCCFYWGIALLYSHCSSSSIFVIKFAIAAFFCCLILLASSILLRMLSNLLTIGPTVASILLILSVSS